MVFLHGPICIDRDQQSRHEPKLFVRIFPWFGEERDVLNLSGFEHEIPS